MPSLSTARRIASMKNNGAKTIGQIHKENSDFVMLETWDNDEVSKVCYIYDYWHDNQKHLNVGMTYDNTTKTKIDAKILVSKYGSIAKDQPELQCMFKPNQKTIFDETDELYYMEEYRRKYDTKDIFVGMYLDVPDKDGLYHKHLICLKDVEQNFQKYYILPCDHKLQFVSKNGDTRTRQEIWCVLRSQSNYNSGLWTDYVYTVTDNQEIIFLPTNSISDSISYVTDDNSANQRIIIDVPNYNPTWTPNSWTVSKLERANVRGRTKVTLKQGFFDQHNDYIEKDENGYIIGLWADYYGSSTPPTDPTEPTPTPSSNYGVITASTSTIKIGGSYKTLTATVFDESGTDITDTYSNATFEWTCSIEGVDNTELDTVITWLDGTKFNKKKIKFSNNRSYLEKILEVKCIITKDTETIETSMQFELIV